MNRTVVAVGPPWVEKNGGDLGGYRVSQHAKCRMTERCVTAEDIEDVFQSRMTRFEVDCAGIAQYRGIVRGRPIRVTVNELANVIVTVAALAPIPGANHWLSIGVSMGYGS